MSDTTTVTAPDVVVDSLPAAGSRSKLPDLLSRYGMLVVLVLVIIGAQITYSGFLDPDNLLDMLSQNAPVGVVAVAMTFVMIAGGFDLSVSAVFAGGSVLYAALGNDMPLPLALLLTLLVGAAAGLANGLIITRMRVNAFIATLGTSSIFGGAVLFFAPSPIIAEKSNFGVLGANDIAGIPLVVWILLAVFVVGAVVLAYSVFGRSVYVVGGNEEAARLAGLRLASIRTITYVLAGIAAALGGAMIASRTGTGQSNVGTTITLDAIAIVIIGGTSLMGGEGAVWRTAIGLLILASINNVFQSMAVTDSFQQIVKGAVVILAVALDAFARRRRA